MKAHTPGPWTTEGQGFMERKRDDNKSPTNKWQNVGLAEGKSIAEVYFPSGKWQDMEGRANAHLISAAPDMLAALQYVVDYHREHDSGEGELYGLDYVTTCIAAIAKATGA